MQLGDLGMRGVRRRRAAASPAGSKARVSAPKRRSTRAASSLPSAASSCALAQRAVQQQDARRVREAPGGEERGGIDGDGSARRRCSVSRTTCSFPSPVTTTRSSSPSAGVSGRQAWARPARARRSWAQQPQTISSSARRGSAPVDPRSSPPSGTRAGPACPPSRRSSGSPAPPAGSTPEWPDGGRRGSRTRCSGGRRDTVRSRRRAGRRHRPRRAGGRCRSGFPVRGRTRLPTRLSYPYIENTGYKESEQPIAIVAGYWDGTAPAGEGDERYFVITENGLPSRSRTRTRVR